MFLAFLRYKPLVRVRLGPLAISPHGVGIAAGFVLGARFFLRWCQRVGIPEETVYSLVTRAAIGSMIGARLAYVLNHPGEFANPLEIFAVWKGGISLLGGITGAVLAGLPKMRAEGLSFWKTMDLAVPCVTMGIIVGRVGDLVIGDHLGKPTGFFLGYVCPAAKTSSPCSAPIGQAVHLPALYDLVSAILLLVVLLRLRRRPRYDGFLTLCFGAWYGAGRLAEDFFRVDETHGTGLTGSQWTALVILSLCVYALVVRRDTPWSSGRGTMASIPRRRAAAEPEAERIPERSDAHGTETSDTAPETERDDGDSAE